MKLELISGGLKMLVDCDSFRVCDPNEPEPEVVQLLPEGERFAVDYKKIDQSLLKKKRDDKAQERLRKLIRKALVIAKWHPKKYAEPFYTLIPKIEWSEKKSVQELKEYAQHLGGYTADGVEQALQ